MFAPPMLCNRTKIIDSIISCHIILYSDSCFSGQYSKCHEGKKLLESRGNIRGVEGMRGERLWGEMEKLFVRLNKRMV